MLTIGTLAATLATSDFTAAATSYSAPRVKYSFTFTGDGDSHQAPVSGCFEQDNGCRSCLQVHRLASLRMPLSHVQHLTTLLSSLLPSPSRTQSWWNFPPDKSYVYNPIVATGCTGKKRTCSFCPPGLTLYTYGSCKIVTNATTCDHSTNGNCDWCTVNATSGCYAKADCTNGTRIAN